MHTGEIYMKKTNLALMALAITSMVGGLTAGVLLASAQNKIFADADIACTHVGSHYEAKAQTQTQYGWNEFWVCCECHQIFLSEPETGTWVTQPVSYMTGTMDATHPAYIPSGNESVINFYSDSYYLCPGDKATLILDETPARKNLFGDIHYAASNPNITVSDNGIITAGESISSADVLVTCDNPYYSATIPVMIINNDRDVGYPNAAYNDGIYTYPTLCTSLAEFETACVECIIRDVQYLDINVDLGDEAITVEDFDYFFTANASMGDLLVGPRFYSNSDYKNNTHDDSYDVISGEGNIKVTFYKASWFSNLDPCSETTPSDPSYGETELTNEMALIRRYQISVNPNKRSATFLDFPFIVDNTLGYMDVANSEQLWTSIMQGYIPRFPNPHTSAEEIYERAKDALRREILDDMSNEEKYLAIYDYIIDNSRYDSEGIGCDIWINNTAWYLEGFFFEGRCVCDAFSKVYAMLCAMEGLDVDRGCGKGTSGGHAWNYVKSGSKWYTICTTWGADYLPVDMDFCSVFTTPSTPYFGITYYETFMADVNYMESSYPDIDFKNFVREGHTAKETISVFEAAKVIGTPYDYDIDSIDELDAIVELCVAAHLTEFLFVFGGNTTIVVSNLYNSCYAAGVSSVVAGGIYDMNDVYYVPLKITY